MAGQRPLEPLVEVRLLPRERVDYLNRDRILRFSDYKRNNTFLLFYILLFFNILESSNGRTAASEAVRGGSTPPSRTVLKLKHLLINVLSIIDINFIIEII